MEKNIHHYEGILKANPTKELEVSSLCEYINAITAINNIYSRMLYRGQPDESWDIVSSAYREIKKSTENPTQKMLEDYHLKLIEEVAKLHDVDSKIDGHSDINKLAHLQHSGAKTNLIDYTLNPLVSLWFACTSHNDKNGAVYCIENSFILNGIAPIENNKTVEDLFNQPNNIKFFQPPNVNRRIISQQGVFLFSKGGIIEKHKHMVITIPKEQKEELLSQLRLMGISRKSLFPDFYGFLEWFSYGTEPQEIYEDTFREAEKYYSEYKYDDAIKLFEEVLKLGEDLFEESSVEIPRIYDYIAGSYNGKGNYQNALEWYRKALIIREEVLDAEHPDIATSYNNIALVYANQGDYPKALEWHQNALTIREKVLGLEHPDIATSYNNIALVYANQGDYPKALELYQKSLVIYEKVLGLEHPFTATGYNNIALVYVNQGDYPKALEWHQKSLDIREKVLGLEHPDTATSYNNIATMYANQGDYPKALELYQKSLIIREKMLGLEHPDTILIKESIAAVNNLLN